MSRPTAKADTYYLVQAFDGSSLSSPAPSPSVVPTPDSRPLSPSTTLDAEVMDDSCNSSFLGCTEIFEDDPPSASPHSSVRNTENLTSQSSESRPEPLLGAEAEMLSSPHDSDANPTPVGAGLVNLGNTCFMNAVLQCITHTVPMIRGLRSCNHKWPCDRSSEEFCILCALREHVENSLASSGGIVSPWKIVDNLNYISSCFYRYQQEDAHEFLQCLLDKLDSCCLDSNPRDNHTSSQHDSMVKKVFGGRLVSKLRCCNCNHCSETYESIIDLSLDIEDVDALPCALESFTKVEKIGDPETKFTCENCKEEVSVEKQFTLDRVPSVAAFHLKRFKNDGSYIEKIDKHVKYPLELDLLPYTNSCQNINVELKYELYAVVVHAGFSSNSGHYFCFVRSSPGSWYMLDDSKVTRIPEAFVLSQKAYILFYARKGTPWFPSLMENQKSRSDLNNSNSSPMSVLDTADGFPTASCNTANLCTPVTNRVKDAVEGSSIVCCNTSHNEVKVNKVKADIHGPKPLNVRTCCDEASYNIDKGSAPPTSGTNICNEARIEVQDMATILPQAPHRSPSPDIYSEEPYEDTFLIPQNHLKLENQTSCKRTLSKGLEDSKRREAVRLMKRSMPTSRSSSLMAAMMGPDSEGSQNKKTKRRMESSPNGASIVRTRRKSCPTPVMHPVNPGVSPLTG